MFAADQFWQDLVSEGLLVPDEVHEAISRWSDVGGSPDTAVLEVRPLSPGARVQLARIGARAAQMALAPPAFLEAPDPRALKFVLPDVCARLGVLPISVDEERLRVVCSAEGSGRMEALGRALGRRVEPFFALELAVRRALARFEGPPLPRRLKSRSTSSKRPRRRRRSTSASAT